MTCARSPVTADYGESPHSPSVVDLAPPIAAGSGLQVESDATQLPFLFLEARFCSRGESSAVGPRALVFWLGGHLFAAAHLATFPSTLRIVRATSTACFTKEETLAACLGCPKARISST